MLGTAQFGSTYGIVNTDSKIENEEAKAILLLARMKGIDILDTAIGYGDSEACLGGVGVSEFKIITKLPPVPPVCNDIPRWVNEQIESSLSRLAVNSLYGVLLHRPIQLSGPLGDSLYSALLSIKESGQAKKIGISIYHPNELENVTARYDIDIVQAPVNIIDQRLIASGWLSKLNASGIEVHARSAFLQGLLLTPMEKIPLKFLKWEHVWRKWHGWLREYGVSPLQACIQFLDSCSEIDRIVIGVDNLEQLAQVIQAADYQSLQPLPDISSTDQNLINPSRWSQF